MSRKSATDKVQNTSRRAAFHHGDTRRAATEAALGLLAREGREALTLRAVAELIGVNHRALYRHFASLDVLKAEVATAGFGRLAAALERVSAGDPRALARAYARFAFAEPALYDLMFALPLRRLYGEPVGDAGPLGSAVRRVTSAAIAAVGSRDTKMRVFRLWGLAHGLIGLYRTGAWRARTDRQAIAFIASLTNA